MKKSPELVSAIESELVKNGVTLESEEALGVISGTIELIQQARKSTKNRARLLAIDSTKEHVSAEAVLGPKQIESLPTWIKSSIGEAKVVGNSGNVIQASDGRKYHLKNPLNHMSGGEWTFFLNSVLNTRYASSGRDSFAHNIRKIHPSPKPPQLMRQIIEFFTKEDGVVLDFFMGVGGTLLGASLCGRRAIGIDLSPQYVDTYCAAAEELGLARQVAIVGDSKVLLGNEHLIRESIGSSKVNLILIDPPYGNMMTKAKSGEATKMKANSDPTPFTDSPNDIGNLELEDFFEVFNSMIEDALIHLEERGHIVIFMKDLQPSSGSTNLLHARVIEDLSKIMGIRYLGLKIWADQGVNLYPYGYPYAYVSNQIHQYILIFQKDNRGKKTVDFD